VTGCTIIFSDDFNDGNANGWTVVNESGRASSWQVINGEYNQLNSVGAFNKSFHTGSYAYYNGGLSLTAYEVTVDIISDPLAGGGADSVGVMFRYKNSSNYYRFSMSRRQGFSRLEKKLNGVFQTIAFDGRGPTLGQVHKVAVKVNGSKIFVYLNGEPLFSVFDSSGIYSGTVALYSQNNAGFDNVVIRQDNNSAPRIIISNPASYSVETTDTLDVLATIGSPVSGVQFVLDEGSPNEASFTDFAVPYSGQFSNLSQGSHTVKASIVDSSGVPIPGTTVRDTNEGIGMSGNYFVAMGDSITNGTGDDFSSDDDSFDGRNLNRGYAPILNDLLTSALSKPITVLNEGLGGTTAANGVSRLNETITRHSKSQYWLIQFGTNDVLASTPPPSGKGLSPGNSGYNGSFKDSMQQIITGLKNSGKTPLLAKVPYMLNAPSIKYQLIQDYNTAIDELVTANNIPVVPPDFYTYFANNQDEFADNLHPNGNGYISMGNLWFDALCQGGILGIPQGECP
jgi:lysophospholipase L1-like esterase